MEWKNTLPSPQLKWLWELFTILVPPWGFFWIYPAAGWRCERCERLSWCCSSHDAPPHLAPGLSLTWGPEYPGGAQKDDFRDIEVVQIQDGCLRGKCRGNTSWGVIWSPAPETCLGLATAADFRGDSEQVPPPARELCQNLPGDTSEKTLPKKVWLRK